MNITAFFRQFTDEDSSIENFYRVKEKRGITFSQRGILSITGIETICHTIVNNVYIRPYCAARTLMEASKLPFQSWLTGMYFMTMTK